MPVPDLLSRTIDAYIGWLAAWQREAFFAARPDADVFISPAIYAEWRKGAAETPPQHQPAIEKVFALHEQLHTLARLVLMDAQDGKKLSPHDYDSVAAKYGEFMQGLRRLERAFAAAASGLDPLTGLRSRTGFAEDMAREQNRFQRTGSPFCIAIMDIDHFKKINDTYGHDAGDKVLASVADHVTRHLRSFDDAWRWGGEEFLLCLKDAPAPVGMAILERLRAGLAAKPVTAEGKNIPVTASFGFAVSVAEVETDKLVHAADQALYRAKHEGRNRVILAEHAKS